MSRAFVKEDQTENPAEEVIPERIPSNLPNYVTHRGLASLKQQVETLRAERDRAGAIEDEDRRRLELARIDRDLRYYQARVESAILVDHSHLPADQVHFGSEVTVADEDGKERTYVIVGEDEADLAQGRISWASPLAHALVNARVEDVVTWKRPSGDRELEVVRIRNQRPEKA